MKYSFSFLTDVNAYLKPQNYIHTITVMLCLSLFAYFRIEDILLDYFTETWLLLLLTETIIYILIPIKTPIKIEELDSQEYFDYVNDSDSNQIKFFTLLANLEYRNILTLLTLEFSILVCSTNIVIMICLIFKLVEYYHFVIFITLILYSIQLSLLILMLLYKYRIKKEHKQIKNEMLKTFL